MWENLYFYFWSLFLRTESYLTRTSDLMNMLLGTPLSAALKCESDPDHDTNWICVIKGLEPLTEYEFEYKTVYGSGTAKDAITFVTKPAAPIISEVILYSTSFRIKWFPVIDAMSYNVQINCNGEITYEQLFTNDFSKDNLPLDFGCSNYSFFEIH